MTFEAWRISFQSSEQAARAAFDAWQADKVLLDWLADTDTTTGQVLLPTVCVEANLTDMRAAIRAAMHLEKTK
ncbi:hypothetical protein [Luteimonas terrae]|uniref:Uncharacterized protein n=1 Tax=Luteimonas terrae TaxID=1530191 RepID=A0ABU1XX49_9GAMM|nr:hypothetical protein [Luteimonas terrae]MDR7193339.1 hypothetical protein [Luteimonas terrae]